MDNSIFLFAAFGLTWSIIFIYIYRIHRGQKALDHQLHEIRKALLADAESGDTVE